MINIPADYGGLENIWKRMLRKSLVYDRSGVYACPRTGVAPHAGAKRVAQIVPIEAQEDLRSRGDNRDDDDDDVYIRTSSIYPLCDI